MSETRCSAKTYGAGWGAPSLCSRKATVQRDGKAYCGQHDPDRVKARREKSEARWRAEHAESTREYNRSELARQLAELAVKEPTTFPPNAQPIIEQLLTLATPRPAHEEG